jgi:hypothetical protein
LSGLYGEGAVLFAAGTALVALVLVSFLRGGGYGRPSGDLSRWEEVRVRRVVEGRISALAARVLLLAEREEAVAALLGSAGMEEGLRREVERHVDEADTAAVWERFAAASAVLEEEPVRAFREIESLPGMLSRSLESLRRAEELLRSRGEYEAFAERSRGG